MIKRWTHEDFINNKANVWCNQVKSLLQDDDEVDSLILGSLQYDSLDDDLDVAITKKDDKYIIVISLIEETHKATDNREENINYIKAFVKQEMPYMEFTQVKNYNDIGDYAFELTFQVQEDVT